MTAFKAEIPFRAYWSTPFCKWQSEFQHLHAIEFASYVTRQEIEARDLNNAGFDYAVLGMTIPQSQCFYGTPWMTSMAGLGEISGPTIAQACATGVRSLATAVSEIELDLASAALVVTTDRTSNGAHIYYPAPSSMGGTGVHENWVLDNFSRDPVGGNSMTQTAENVAERYNIDTLAQHEVVLRRYEQYQDSLANEHEFQKRYMRLPFDVPRPRLDKIVDQIDGDVGITPVTREGLTALKPVLSNGTVTFAAQTHPADGSAAMIITSSEKAADLSSDPNVRIRFLGFGQARVEQAFMPEAVIPAADMALRQSGLTISDIDAVKTHNPFAINDILFSQKTGFPLERMNNYGCSLIWGHPQAPTGTRSIIELIEELAERSGGTGLFSGCAAGDTAMAVIISVDVTS